MAQRKSWREKLADSKDLPKVIQLSGKMAARFGAGTMVIPAPLEVDAIMRRIPKGRLITINEIRESIAKEHGASVACPITTGIFAWIAAHAADEAIADGKKRVTPYWRTLKSGGELNAKYPGGLARLRRNLIAEGHRLVTKGKRVFVKDFESRIARLG